MGAVSGGSSQPSPRTRLPPSALEIGVDSIEVDADQGADQSVEFGTPVRECGELFGGAAQPEPPGNLQAALVGKGVELVPDQLYLSSDDVGAVTQTRQQGPGPNQIARSRSLRPPPHR